MKGVNRNKIVALTLLSMTILTNSMMTGCTSSQETFNPDGIQLKTQNSDNNSKEDNVVEDKKTKNSKDGGNNAVEWKLINDTWYCYDNYGSKQIGWIKDDDKWFYMDPYCDGAMVKGWILLNNNWYYTNSDGAIETGFVRIDDVTYYFSSNGVMQNISTIGKPEWKVDKNDILFEYSLLRSGNYIVSTEIYDSNDKQIRTCNWNYKKTVEEESKQFVSVSGRLGEMKSGDYIIANVVPDNDLTLNAKSEKMAVIENSAMNIDVSKFEISGDVNEDDKEYCNFTLTSNDRFKDGIYVIYGQDSKDSNNTFIGTSYCNGDTNTIDFKNVISKFIDGEVSNFKLARIYDIQIDENLSGTCKIQVSDKFSR